MPCLRVGLLLLPDAGSKLSSFLRCSNDPAKDIVKFQMKRIRETIQSVVRYLAKDMLGNTPGSAGSLMPDHPVAEESKYLYVLTTIWYVINAFKGDEAWDCGWAIDTPKWNFPDSHLFERLHPPDRPFGSDDKAESQLLLWFHHASLANLCKHKRLPQSWLEPDYEARLRELEKAAKVVAATKYSSKRDYAAEDEIFDRLSLVSDELGFAGRADLKQSHPGMLAKLSMKRIKERDSTRGLGPGWLPDGAHGSISGPWETHALCHHSHLAALTLEDDWRSTPETMEEVDVCKCNILNFLNAEGTLVPCWERAHTQTRRGWLRSEATAVVASTCISMLGMALASEPEVSAATNREASNSSSAVRSPTAETNTEQALVRVEQVVKLHAEQALSDQAKLHLEVRRMEAMVMGSSEILEKLTNEADRPPPIKWMSFRPPRIYHPTGFFNSLEDTPSLYRPPKIKDAPIPASLEGAVRLPEEMVLDKFAFTRDTISKPLPSQCLFVSDLLARGRDQASEVFTWEIRHLKYDDSNDKTKKKSREQLSWTLYDSVRTNNSPAIDSSVC